MGTLDARRTYIDGSILFAADLDAIIDDIETFVNTTKLNDDNLQDQGITGSAKLIDASVTAGKLASNAITTTKIADANVTTPKIADEAVTRAKIDDVERIPTGVLMPFAGTTAPAGWLLADGSTKSRTTYADLYAVIGLTYNTGGETGTEFRLPGTPGRAIIGAGAGTGLTTRVLGAVGGAETHQLTEAEMPTHTHVATQPAHSHGYVIADNTGSFGDRPGRGNGGSVATGTTNNAQPAITVNNTGGGAAHNNMQPFIALNHIIKY